VYAFHAVDDPLVKWLHETRGVWFQMSRLYMPCIKNLIIVCMPSLYPLSLWHFDHLKPLLFQLGIVKQCSSVHVKNAIWNVYDDCCHILVPQLC
jgi:hypothetical protein